MPKAGVGDVPDMIRRAGETARREGLARMGDTIVIAAGMPIGISGTTNLLHIASA